VPLTHIAIVAPSRSLPSWKASTDASLAALLLPSLQKSLSFQEQHSIAVEVIVVFDEGDSFWENPSVRSTVELSVTSPVQILFMSVKKSSRIPNNEGCQMAYERGAHYIVRVNDDTEFTGVGWITAGMSSLKSFTPPNLGVVGPTCRQGNTKILTHDMVHRTHLDIFTDYYPREFDNWYLDDWISRVYGDRHTRRLTTWIVIHHTDAHGQRYNESTHQKKMLPEILVRSKQQIIDFLTLHTKAQRPMSVSDLPTVKVFPSAQF
jgi:hypothetical protein